MNIRFKSIALASLVGLSSATYAATDVMSTTREQRMDDALKNYRGNNGSASTSSTRTSSSMSDSRPGPVARSEESVKRVSRRTGHAVANGARKTGHAVASGARTGGHYVAEAARKTGSAIRRTGEKMGGSSTTPGNNGNDSHVGK